MVVSSLFMIWKGGARRVCEGDSSQSPLRWGRYFQEFARPVESVIRNSSMEKFISYEDLGDSENNDNEMHSDSQQHRQADS